MSLAAAFSNLDSSCRQSERHSVSLRCDVVDNGCDRPRIQRAIDMSTTGMWLRTLMPLEIGEQVTVTFPYADGRVTLFGEVVRKVGLRERRADPQLAPGMAVRFLGLSPSEERQLADYLATLPPKHDVFRDVLGWHVRRGERGQA